MTEIYFLLHRNKYQVTRLTEFTFSFLIINFYTLHTLLKVNILHQREILLFHITKKIKTIYPTENPSTSASKPLVVSTSVHRSFPCLL